jgi:hypothetical protein
MMISALLLTAMLVGCGENGPGRPPSPDAGMMAMDAGDPGTDAGDPGTDAGDPGTDAGDPGTDAGMMASGACTNAEDTAIFSTVNIDMIVESCVRTSFGAQPATSNCIQMMSGLSDGCTACFGDTVTCVTMNCLTQCIAGGASPGCVSCRMMNCDPAFAVCSGLAPM